jgi:hypothetical protein
MIWLGDVVCRLDSCKWLSSHTTKGFLTYNSHHEVQWRPAQHGTSSTELQFAVWRSEMHPSQSYSSPPFATCRFMTFSVQFLHTFIFFALRKSFHLSSAILYALFSKTFISASVAFVYILSRPLPGLLEHWRSVNGIAFGQNGGLCISYDYEPRLISSPSFAFGKGLDTICLLRCTFLSIHILWGYLMGRDGQRFDMYKY